jgi:hypothetical protein
MQFYTSRLRRLADWEPEAIARRIFLGYSMDMISRFKSSFIPAMNVYGPA